MDDFLGVVMIVALLGFIAACGWAAGYGTGKHAGAIAATVGTTVCELKTNKDMTTYWVCKEKE